MKSRPIADFLGEPGPFYRSVSIKRDRHDPAAGHGYVLTPWLDRSVRSLVKGLKSGATRRAWRIVGDFGVGKSALALALIQALDPRMRGAQPAVTRILESEGGVPRMYPLVLSGSRAGLGASLFEAICEALDRDGDLFPDAGVIRDRAAANPFECISLLRDLAVDSGAFDGLLLVIDEMGKFLEIAAFDPDNGDIFRLQELAEQAARSGEQPIAVLLVLHQGFQSYAEDGALAMRTEWTKVAERFDELIFDHPLSHTAALLAAALNVAKLPTSIAAAYQKTAKSVRQYGWLGPREAGADFQCYPLHPATVPAMSRFFASFGQNERSLFGFVASGEPNGVRAFAAAARSDAGYYRLDHFFDYVATSFGHRLLAKGGGDWERIRSVLEGARDLEERETVVLKTIGLLNLIDAPDLVPTRETLAACLQPTYADGEVDDALEGLLERGLVFERPGRPGFRLWTSRRVDLSALWADAGREITARAVSAELARHLATLPLRDHLLARRHSVQRGTTRRFSIRLVPASALAVTDPGAGADGSVVCILTNGTEEYRHAIAWSQEATGRDPTVLAVVAPPMPETAPFMIDLLRHRWMIANAVALQEDLHAAAEIARGSADLENRLIVLLEATFGLGGQAPQGLVQTFHRGHELASPPAIHVLISEVCDDLFADAPIISNELINRHALTSAGAGARQRLIEAVFASEGDPDLGFDGSRNPPERALFLSLLRRGKIHRQNLNLWIIAVPEDGPGADPLNLRPAMLKLQDIMARSPDRVPVTLIYDELAARPFGIRAGLSPLLLALVIAANRHRVALFERGTYCPKVDGPAFMRILKAPEHFDLQWVSLEGVRADVFRRLASLVEGGDFEAGMLSVVTPLVKFGADLPFHVQRTTVIDPTAMAVRDALLSARSPVDLIFRDLPKACGVEPFDPDHGEDDRERVDIFVTRLEAAIAELRQCYPGLLAAMRTDVRELTAAGENMRADLQSRAAAVKFRIQEQALKTFALRLDDAGLSDDGWTEALGGAVIGKPPTRWLTQDVALWRSRLDQLASAFQRVEAASFGSGPESRDAVRLSLTQVDGHEHALIVNFDDADQQEDVFANSILRMIDDNELSLDRMLALLSLHAIKRRGTVGARTGKDDEEGEARGIK